MTTELDEIAKALAFGHILGAEEFAKQHGTIVGAAANWAVATYVDNQIRYLGVIAFVIGPDRIRSALTAESYELRFSALLDPCSGRFVGFDGRTYTTEASFVAAMRFLAEAPGSRSTETAAH